MSVLKFDVECYLKLLVYRGGGGGVLGRGPPEATAVLLMAMHQEI